MGKERFGLLPRPAALARLSVCSFSEGFKLRLVLQPIFWDGCSGLLAQVLCRFGGAASGTSAEADTGPQCCPDEAGWLLSVVVFHSKSSLDLWSLLLFFSWLTHIKLILALSWLYSFLWRKRVSSPASRFGGETTTTHLSLTGGHSLTPRPGGGTPNSGGWGWGESARRKQSGALIAAALSGFQVLKELAGAAGRRREAVRPCPPAFSLAFSSRASAQILPTRPGSMGMR